MALKILKMNPCLQPFTKDLQLRMDNFKAAKKRLLKEGQTLSDFANGHHYFGIHCGDDGWYYREWAPGADALYFTGDFCGWNRHAHPVAGIVMLIP